MYRALRVFLRWAMRRWLTERLQELLSQGTALKPLHLVLSLVRPSSVLLLDSIADEPGITVEWVLTNELEGGGRFSPLSVLPKIKLARKEDKIECPAKMMRRNAGHLVYQSLRDARAWQLWCSCSGPLR